MKTRLLAFALTLLLLPALGLFLGGRDWDELTTSSPADRPIASLAALAALLCWALLAGRLIQHRTGSNPLRTQRPYYLALAACGAATGWLLVMLNLYAPAWMPPAPEGVGILLDTLLFALAMPTVLLTRALLGAFPGLLKMLSRGLPLPLLRGETAALTLITLAAFGLLGGAAMQQAWLLWFAPLPLLLALQLMWHEGTIFDVLHEGDWGRLICALLAGLLVGNLALAASNLGGGLQQDPPTELQAIFALFGLLSLQLGDVVAEHWRGKSRAQLARKKPFPIPVIVKK